MSALLLQFMGRHFARNTLTSCQINTLHCQLTFVAFWSIVVFCNLHQTLQSVNIDICWFNYVTCVIHMFSIIFAFNSSLIIFLSFLLFCIFLALLFFLAVDDSNLLLSGDDNSKVESILKSLTDSASMSIGHSTIVAQGDCYITMFFLFFFLLHFVFVFLQFP